MKNPARPPAPPRRLSLAAQTADCLREGIRSGHWKGHLPGERSLCEQLQVSRRTLRLALKTLEKEGALRTSGRSRRGISAVRAKARSGRPGKKVIAVLMPSSLLSVPTRLAFVLDALRSKLNAAGYEVQFHFNARCYKIGANARALADFVTAHPAAAWIVLSSREFMQRWFARQRIPCLLLGSCAHGIDLPSVDVDFHATCHHAGATLLRKGHRRIAFVVSKNGYVGEIASQEGLESALCRESTASLMVLRHNGSADSVCSAIEQSLRVLPALTAYVVCGTAHVLTVVMHLMRRGRRIPADVSVVSRDGDPILESASPTLARYDTQPGRLASEACRAVRQILEAGDASPKNVRLMPEFVPGESVGIRK